MRILLASSEVQPYSKTGGLADMAASMAKELARLGHDVTFVTPLYQGIADSCPDLKGHQSDIRVSVGDEVLPCNIWSRKLAPNHRILFIGQERYFNRPALYTEDGVDYEDNAERFIFFSKVVARLARHAVPHYDIVHAHDWQTGLVPLYLLHERRSTGWGSRTRTCLTIHNLAYQGVFPSDTFELTNLPPEYSSVETSEFHGQLNLLKVGIATADAITTVSPRYAREITTEEFGCGLDGLLRHRQDRLTGVLNGVDYEQWRTSRNPNLSASYSVHRMAGKLKNKLALQEEVGLDPSHDVPLFASITRLVDQKGVDLMLNALKRILGESMQFVMLGNGDPHYESAFLKLATSRAGKVSVRIGYDMGLAHRIEAGADFFLMPSRFEPCGLNQLYSLRYGTIPIVCAVGGLDDSVTDLKESKERANGIKFYESSSSALLKSIQKALALYGEPPLLAHYRRNGMKADFSSAETALNYQLLYQHLLEE